MSINITDKVADTVEVLIENTNQAITTVNNQLDVSVLANLKTTNKDTLVNAINDLVDSKLGTDASSINNDFTVNGQLTANSIKIKTDEDGNSSVYFYNTSGDNFVKLFWNNSLQKWQLSFPDGSIVDILNTNDLNNIQDQIDDISNKINYNFNTNGKTLIMKQLSSEEIVSYVGEAGEIVINSDDWGEIRVQDGVTPGGNIISGSLVIDWQPDLKVKKGQCILYGEGLYRAKEAHTTSDTFQIDLYDILAAYKKYVESQVIREETNKITLAQSVKNKTDLDINVGGLIVQRASFDIIDPYHIRFAENLPVGAEIEITYYKASNLINSSIVKNLYVTSEENETIIPLNEEVENKLLVSEVNIENTSILSSEWDLAEGNQAIVLKNPVKQGSRIEVTFWKGVNVAQNGITFKPKIVDNTLVWENDGGLPNPDPISITTTNTKQTISGEKTFNNIKVPTKNYNDVSTSAASTEFVNNFANSNRTNCITKIPQDIKLELKDGVLTLKAGSKVYIPNGVGVFDEVVIESDISSSPTYDGTSKMLLYYRKISLGSGFVLDCASLSIIFSQSGAPNNPGNGWVWYDTTNNAIKRYNTNNSTWEILSSTLPVAEVQSTSNAITSIDQVFNGFGYIGNTVFALPGVEGLIPNGRNADGSLKNIKFTTTSVLTYTRTWDTQTKQTWFIDKDLSMFIYDYYIESTEEPSTINTIWYNPNTNITYRKGDSGNFVELPCIPLSSVDNGGKISSFSPKNVFQAVDRNDTEWASTAGKPSDRYTDIPLQASGTKYTAPASGYFFISKQGSSPNQFVYLFNTLGGVGNQSVRGEGSYAITNIPVIKGDIIQADYTADGEGGVFRFVYDEGSK